MSSSYKEGNGVRASEDELPCSFSIKLPFFSLACIYSFSGTFLDSNRFTWQEQKKNKNTSTFLSFVPSFLLFLFRILHVQGFLLPSPRCPDVTASSLLYSLKPCSEAGAVQLFPPVSTHPLFSKILCDAFSHRSEVGLLPWCYSQGRKFPTEIFKRRKSSNVSTKTRSFASLRNCSVQPSEFPQANLCSYDSND